jgi:class 3 adenylate cyclase
VTYLEHHGRPTTAIVHDPAVLDDPSLAESVMAAVRFVVQNDRAYDELTAKATDAAALPTGFVSLLMTDIEGSTALLRRMGDSYRDLLNDVRVVLRTAVSRAGGREIDVRADEFFAVFERALDAVVAAATMQRDLRARSWPHDLDVRVRIGIHSGVPTHTDVGYIGLAVHTAARVSSAAHGEQILVSGATREAVESPARAGIRFRSLGRHRLHGLADPEALFQVMAKGLRASFPPPRTKGRSRKKS